MQKVSAPFSTVLLALLVDRLAINKELGECDVKKKQILK